MGAITRLPLPVVLVGTAGLALFFGVILQTIVPAWRSPHVPLHSAIEALGGLCAIVMALLLFKRRDDGMTSQVSALGVGFLSMGVLEEFHAVAFPQNAFVFLRSLASFVGGAGFVLVWLPESCSGVLRGRRLPWMVAGTSVLMGLTILAFPDRVPDMVRNGEFSPTAVAPTSLASMLFLATAVRFALDYRGSRTADAYLFACLALLFGLAEFMFTYSLLWDARWWFWHFLRLFAYLLVLGYLIRGYQCMMADLHVSLAQTRAAEESVRQREQDLRQALEERERIGQDLHDGIIQSLFALALNLERCRRLIATQPEEVMKQLDLAVVGVKAMIRDLRGYLVGMEPHIADGRELEAALALQARMMENSSGLHFAVQVDPEAAACVGPDQAVHLVYIAREAMSNALRHARARQGTVSLERHDGGVCLMIEDDGIGFDVEMPHTGEGLRNIASRAAKLHARVRISSKPGEGTRIVLDVPTEPMHG